MTKDNACGAAMEIARSLVQDEFHIVSALGNDADIDGAMLLVDALIAEARTDADRLLAESQAQNVKLEAQVERMRQALQPFADGNWTKELAATAYAAIESIKP